VINKAYMLILKIDVYKQNILKSFGDNQLKVILIYGNKETEWLYQRRKNQRAKGTKGTLFGKEKQQ